MTDSLLTVRDFSRRVRRGSARRGGARTSSLDTRSAARSSASPASSGCGKTTLAYGMQRLLKPPAVITAGSVVFHDAARRRHRHQRASTPRTTARVPLGQGLDGLPGRDERAQPGDHDRRAAGRRVHDAPPGDEPGASARERVRRAARDRRGRAASGCAPIPHELSGGMRQRVMIAMALALDPQLMIMDEPTTALDVLVQREILQQISQLRDEFGFSVIFITHDLPLLLEISDRIAIMREGEIVELDTAGEHLPRPAARVHAQAARLVPAASPASAAASSAATPRSSVDDAPSSSRTSPRSTACAAPAELHALDDVSFTLRPGQTIALVGQSGSGKSTIAKILTQLETPTRGRGPARRRADPASRGSGCARYRQQRADGLPGPVRLAEPVPHDPPPPRAAAAAATTSSRATRSTTRCAACSSACSSTPDAVDRPPPARAVRRPAAARRDRPRARVAARAAGRRRAGVDARRVDPARRAEPARRPAARGGPRRALHHPRPRHGPALQRRDHGAEPAAASSSTGRPTTSSSTRSTRTPASCATSPDPETLRRRPHASDARAAARRPDARRSTHRTTAPASARHPRPWRSSAPRAFYLFTAWAAITINFFLPRMMKGDPVTAYLARNQGQHQPRGRSSRCGSCSASTTTEPLLAAVRRLLGHAAARRPRPLALHCLAPGRRGRSPRRCRGRSAWSASPRSSLPRRHVARRGRRLAARRTADVLVPVTTFFSTVPYFWLGLIVIALFSTTLGWFPAVARVRARAWSRAGTCDFIGAGDLRTARCPRSRS